ncbi:hypothetical protein FPZ11_09655 [Humibacter ginsenosidimutans]|uniref:Methylamine utilisation protein MauE domain-containing protein n=1 Tax=Humibacter ginsenosidimutans TaxID=2599293 RepID=A0A5B8M4Z0_9MICO|nr:hypothetical protein FPZ11_09655 [Humibacter ginsenosidimutans]
MGSVLVELSTVLPLTLAVVLVTSALGKLRAPDGLEGWAELGVPKMFRRQWLLRLHPWGELVLGVCVAVFGGVPGVVLSLVAVALMAAYTWLVLRAVRQEADASCSCFGARKRVTWVTVFRNIWLLLVAVGSATVTGASTTLGGALTGLTRSAGLTAALVALIAAVTAALILWPEGGEPSASRDAVPHPDARLGDAGEAGEELDYLRTRTPAVPVTAADGTVHNLRTLTRQRPVLLLAVSPTCSACLPVIERIGDWRALLPEVDIRFLLRSTPEESELIEHDEPQSLHDSNGYVSGSIQDWSTPAAVLLGVDGLLAGGPIIGSGGIEHFIAEIDESLHGEG